MQVAVNFKSGHECDDEAQAAMRNERFTYSPIFRINTRPHLSPFKSYNHILRTYWTYLLVLEALLHNVNTCYVPLIHGVQQLLRGFAWLRS